jgi:hypothetical protein
MTALLLLGLLLLAVVAFAARVATDGIRALPIDAAALRTLGPNFGEALRGEASFALEPLREAALAPSGPTREAWLAEADGVLAHHLRVPAAELGACAKIANAASFACGAWSLRLALAADGGPSFALDGPLGQALGCVVLGFVATGAVTGMHRASRRVLRNDRSAFAALVKILDGEEIARRHTESRA